MIVSTAGPLDPAGPAAAEIARLWWVLLGLGSLVAVGVLAFLAAGLLRRRRADVPADPDSIRPSRWIWAGGVVMPAVVLTVVLGVSTASMSLLDDEVPDGALVVEVTGHRWWWEIRYEAAGFTTANEMHIPVDRPVYVVVSSADVIHSFWVPALAGKIDALPDHPNSLVLQADEPGTYRGACAEFCGLQHANMQLLVVAHDADGFSQWVKQQQAVAVIPSEGEAGRGAEVFLASECADCHRIAGTSATGDAGPDLTHVASRISLGALTTDNSPEQLRSWIAHPDEVKAGVLMPEVALTEAEIDAVVAFLETLR